MPALNRPLDGARAKFNWASERFDDLDAYVGNIRAEAESHAIVVEYDPDEGAHIAYSWLPTEDRLIRASLLLGDILHSARAALDFLTWQLAVDHLGHAPSEADAPKVKFPICSSPNQFRNRALWRFVSKGAKRRLADYQPYPDRRRDLAVLEWLRDRDRHRLILPILSVTARESSMTYGFEPALPADVDPATIVTKGPDLLVARPGFNDQGGKSIVRRIFLPTPHPEDTKMHANADVTVEVFFDGPFGKVGMADLRAIVAHVGYILFDEFVGVL